MAYIRGKKILSRINITLGGTPEEVGAIRKSIAKMGGSVADDASLREIPSAIESIPVGDANYVLVEDSAVAYEKVILSGARSVASVDKIGGMTTLVLDDDGNYLPFPYVHDTAEYFDSYTADFVAGNHTLTAPNDKSQRIPAGDYRLELGYKVQMAEIDIWENGRLRGYSSDDGGGNVDFTTTSSWSILSITFYAPRDVSIYPVLRRAGANVQFKARKTTPSINHIKTTAIKSVGMNIWDEQWESGYIDFATGNLYDEPTLSRSKNFINVKPNTQYYMHNGSWEQTRVGFYDSEYRILGGETSNTFVTPSNCHYIKFYWLGTVYNNDICINKFDTVINGKYSPHKESTLPIPTEVQNIDGYGWGVNENVYNYVDWGAKKFHRVLEKVILDGSDDEVWMIDSGNFKTSIADISTIQGSVERAFAVCDKYEATENTTLPDKSFYCHSTWFGYGSVVFKDSSVTLDVVAWRAHLAESPITLIYTRYTPKVENIPSILSVDTYVPIEEGGSIVFENAQGQAVPNTISYVRRIG